MSSPSASAAPAAAQHTPVINDFSIQVATVNGSGSQTANLVLLRAIFQMGVPVSGKNLFPSNIARLPTWFTIRASKDGYIGRKKEIDFSVLMNPETAREDVMSLAPGSPVVYDEPLKLDALRTDLVFYPVPFDKIVNAVTTDAKLPSGAHQQPWTFVAVADPELKRQIREAAEREEREFYHGRAPAECLEALAPLGTDEHKLHLTDAPWVVVLFRQAHGVRQDGSKQTFYYTQESCGIAAGFFIAAVHLMGLVTLTHTPNPMGFLAQLLGRPDHEKAMLVMPVGYPAPDPQVPDLTRKPLDQIADWR